VSNNEGVAWVGVDLVVFSILGSEDLHSEGVFFLSSVVDVVAGNVVHESLLDIDILGKSESSNDTGKHFFGF